MDHAVDPSLHLLLDSARAAEAARSRAGFDSLRNHLAEDATVVGLLANLLDCRALVAIRTHSGAERRGRVELVGECGIVLSCAGGGRALIRVSAIALIRSGDIERLDGDGAASVSMSWPSMISRFIESECDVIVTIAAGTAIGRVHSISRSVLTLAAPGGMTTYVVLDSIEEVSLNVPGMIRHD